MIYLEVNLICHLGNVTNLGVGGGVGNSNINLQEISLLCQKNIINFCVDDIRGSILSIYWENVPNLGVGGGGEGISNLIHSIVGLYKRQWGG